MAASIVQHAETITPSASATEATVTLGSAPTPGNWLFGFFLGGNGDETVTPPSGWTKHLNDGTGGNYDLRCLASRKVQSGDSATITFTTNSSGDTFALVVFEVSGLVSTNPIDKTVSDSHTESTANHWQFASTGTLSQADELAIGVMGYWETGPFNNQWPSGWTEELDIYETAGWDMMVTGGSKVTTSTAALSPDITITGLHRCFGVLITLKAASALEITPSVVSQTVAAFDPEVGLTIHPGVVTQPVAAFDPEVGLHVAPGVASQLIQAFDPQLGLGVSPATVTRLVQPFDPQLGLGIAPTTVTQPVQAFDPTVSSGITIAPATVTQLFQAFDPAVGLNIAVDPVAQLIAAFDPTVTTGGSLQQITPGLVVWSIQAFDPTVVDTTVVRPTFLIVDNAMREATIGTDGQRYLEGPHGIRAIRITDS